MQAAENAFTDAVMASSTPLQEELFAEIMARLPANDSSTPQRQGGFWYYSYRRAGGAYRVHCRCAPLARSAGSRAPAPVCVHALRSLAACAHASLMPAPVTRASGSRMHPQTPVCVSTCSLRALLLCGACMRCLRPCAP